MSGPHHPIFIIGFMASGKTTAGRALSERLHRPFLDLDSAIEMAAGRLIHELIQDLGEDAFRDLESNELGKAAKLPGAIIATGGGIILREANRSLMTKTGTMIWLDTPFEECWRRIELDTTVRPLAPRRESARNRWLERRDLYALAAYRIELTGIESSEEVTELILEWLRRE